jgi:hypothetical protein
MRAVLLTALFLGSCSRAAPNAGSAGAPANEARSPEPRRSEVAPNEPASENGLAVEAHDAQGAGNVPSGRWEPLPTEGAPSPRETAGAIFVDDLVVVWGGDDEATERALDDLSISPRGELAGGVFDMTSRRWRPMATDGQPQRGRTSHPPEMYALSGRRVIVCPTARVCALYDIDHDRWQPMAMAPFQRQLQPFERLRCVAGPTCADLVCVNSARGQGSSRRFDAYQYEAAQDRWLRVAPTSSMGLITQLSLHDTAVQVLVQQDARPHLVEIHPSCTPGTLGRIEDLGELAMEYYGGYITTVDPRPSLVNAFMETAGEVCDDAGSCMTRYRSAILVGRELRCVMVSPLRGPTVADDYAGYRSKRFSCSALSGPASFLCHGERILFDNPRYRMRAHQSDGFGCAFEDDKLRCWPMAHEGQPSLRRNAARALGGDRLFMWGGRATTLTDPSGDCVQYADMPFFCGMARNGPLLADGAVYYHQRGTDVVESTPCQTERVDGTQ